MTLTPNYDPNGLSPQLFIHNHTKAVPQNEANADYVYQSGEIDASPRQDFKLATGGLHGGINDDPGSFVFTIDDPGNTLTDTKGRRAAIFGRQWDVQLYLGKSSADLNRWFYGKIMDTDVVRPDTNLQQIRVICSGWGERFKNRMTNIKRFQDKLADGLALDATDNDAKVSELFKDIVEDTDHYIDQGLVLEPDITVTGVQDIDIKLADFQQTGQTWSSAMSQLAACANAYWGIDQNKDVFLTEPGTLDSGFLFTNDLAGLIAQGWNAKKIGYLEREPVTFTDSVFSTAFSHIHGLGANTQTLTVDTTDTPNGDFSMNGSWIAIPFTPTHKNIAKIALSLLKTGTPASGEATFWVSGNNGATPAAPNFSDIRGKGTLAQTKLIELDAVTPEWIEIGFDNRAGISVEPNIVHFLIIKRYGSVSHDFDIQWNTAGTGDYYTSTDGDIWSVVTSQNRFLYRIYSNNPINLTLEDPQARNKWGTREFIFSFRQSVQEETAIEALFAASNVLSKERRIYSDLVVSPVTDKIPLGKFCRIQDSLTGLDTFADIVAYDLSFNSYDTTSVGARKITLKLEELH